MNALGGGPSSSSYARETRSSCRRWLNRVLARQGIAEVGKAIAAPGESFGVDFAIFPAWFGAGLGMIDNPVLGLAKGLNKRTMSDAPDLFGFFENRPVFNPRRRVQHIPGVVVQHPQAVVSGPTAARGVNDKQVAIAFEHL